MVMDLIFIIGFTNETPVRMPQTAIYESEVQLETLSIERLREHTFKHGAEKDSSSETESPDSSSQEHALHGDGTADRRNTAML